MQLRGVSDLQGVLFGLRADEVVTEARLSVSGAASNALIPSLSQIAVTLNEQAVGTIPVDPARGVFGPLDMPLDPLFFSELNRLNFRFSGRYAVECNDPLSGLLWATVSDLSTVTMRIERLPPQRDLARLPEPLFDRRVLQGALTLPFVISDSTGPAGLRAAAVAASWFAVQADYRGATFPVDRAPPAVGNAVVLAVGTDAVPGLTLPRFEGPTLALVVNPTDPFGTLLVLGGRTEPEALAAATALAVGRGTLSGEIARVAAPTLAVRQPYDAPRWVRTDAPVSLGSLVDRAELQSYGFAPGPIRIPLRTAPDLATWRNRGFPVDLRFRAPPGPVVDVATSRLDVSLSDSYLRSFPLGAREHWWSPITALWADTVGETEVRTGRAQVPSYLLLGKDELQLRFDMRPLARGDCTATPGDIRAAVDPDSTVDLSRAHRYARMPNLGYFASSGFPFTRMADLSGTAAVLPERPNPVETGAFLDLVGQLAAVVGLPATGLQVVHAGGLNGVAGRDLLVLGTLGRQPALATLLRDTPVRLEGDRLAVALPGPLDGVRSLLLDAPAPAERNRAAAMLQEGGEGLAAIVGAESPLQRGRSVVAVIGATPAAVAAMVGALRDPEQSPRVQGDVALLSGGRVAAFRTMPVYGTGEVPWWLRPQLLVGDRPERAMLVLLAGVALLGVPFYWMLRPARRGPAARADAEGGCGMTVRNLPAALLALPAALLAPRYGAAQAPAPPPAALAAVAPLPAAAPSGAVALLVRQAERWLSQDRPDLAAASIERALAAEPRNPAALAVAARIEAARNNRGSAATYLDRLRAAGGTEEQRSQADQAVRGATVDRAGLEEARRLARQGQAEQALARYRAAFGGGTPPDAYALEYYQTLAGTTGGAAEGQRGLTGLAGRAGASDQARLALAQTQTYQPGTRAEGIRRLAELAGRPEVGEEARRAWRQALVWSSSDPAGAPAIEAYLQRFPDDAELRRRLETARAAPVAAPDPTATTRREGFQRLEAGSLRDAARQFEAALAANPNDADALGGLGIVRLREGRLPDARGLLERAQAANPAGAANWQRALDGASYGTELSEGRAALRRGDVEAADTIARRAARREVEDRTDAEILLGEVALRRGDPAAAEARFRAALARRPGFATAQVGLNAALRAQGRLAESPAPRPRPVAERAEQPADADGPVAGGTPGQAGMLRAEAARSGDPGVAAALLRNAVALAPNDPWLRLDLARALRRQGRGAEARAVVEELAGGGGAEANYAAALLADEDSRPTDAEAYLARIPPARRSADMARLQARLRVRGDVARAAALLQGSPTAGRQALVTLAARPDPTGSTAAAAIRALADAGDRYGAAEAARAAAAANRGAGPTARVAVAGALLAAGLEAEAASLADQVETGPLTPEQRRDVTALRAGIAVRGSDRANEGGAQATGFERLRPVLERDPANADAQLALGRLYQGARQPAEALRIAEAVLARDPRNADARRGAMDAAIALRDRARAEALLAEAQALAPRDSRTSYLEARVARAFGEEGRARRALEAAAAQRQAELGGSGSTNPFGAAVPAPGGLENPFARSGAASQSALALPTDPLARDIARDLAAVQADTAPRIGLTAGGRERSGSSGLDRVQELSGTLEASVATEGIGGRLTARALPVTLDAGRVSGDLNAQRRFGTNVLGTGTVPSGDNTASGVGLGLGYARGDALRLDVATSPLGFRTTNVLGSAELAPLVTDTLRLRLRAERQSVTDSLLSWAGLRDPRSGREWGGVVRTGGRAQLELPVGRGYVYAGGGYSVFEADNTASNSRVEAGAGMAYPVYRRDGDELTAGLDLVYFAYDRNLRYFTLGQGGYYSPQSYTAINLPVDYRGRVGDLSYRVGGTVGYTIWREDSSPLFPNDPTRQRQVEALSATDSTVLARYPGQARSGFIGGARADLDYALTPSLTVGGTLRYDKAANWNETRFLLRVNNRF